MPVPFAQQPTFNPDTFNTWGASQPALDPEAGYQAITQDSELGPRLERFGQHLVRNFQATVGLAQGNEPDLLSSDEANAQYGVPGYLRFNQPVLPGDAADMATAAHQTAWRDYALGHSQLNPLRAFGAGLDGAIVDPLGLPLMLAGGELVSGGKALFAGGEGVEAAGEAGMAFSRLGRVGNAALGLGATLAEGAVSNVPYVAADYGLRQADGQDDYHVTNALTDIAAGAILHTSLHYGGEGLRAALRLARGPEAPGAEAAPQVMDEFVPHVPDAVADLPPFDRMGAFRMAADSMAADEPVRVGELVDRARAPTPEGLAALSETSAAPQIPSFRPGEEALAVTAKGTEVPVRYGVAEAGDLTTSHDDAYGLNSAYPNELQPRSQAREFEPGAEPTAAMAGRDPQTRGGAPVVGPDGVVESGNGGVINLRRAAAEGSESYAAYRARLEAKGYSTEGMQAPVLVRMRTRPMAGAERASLAREMRAPVETAPETPEGHEAPPSAAHEPDEARQRLSNLNQQFARNDAGKLDLRAPGRASDAAPQKPTPLVLDLSKPKVAKGVKAGAEEAEPEAGKPAEGQGAAQVIAADPELKAIADETDRLAAQYDLDADKGERSPDDLFKGLKAAAQCFAAQAA